MGSPQTLSEGDRRIVAAWAADCAERVLWLFEAEAPEDRRPRDAAARAAGQAAAVAHMGAHALGAAAYAAKAAALAAPDQHVAVAQEIRWQLIHMSAPVKAALQLLPPLGEDSSGPLGPGLLASGLQGTIIRDLQAGLADPDLSSWRAP